MEYVLSLNIIAVIFSFLESKGVKNGLFISFCFIFIFSALRYDYGNDYRNYIEGFNEINSTDGFSLLFEKNHFEPGWIVLCKLFEPFGFFGLVAFMSLLNGLIFFHLIKTYVPVGFYWLAMFVYLFTPNLFLVQLSVMRQNLAIIIFIYSIRFIYERKFLFFLICNLLAFSFHKSAIILLPSYFIGGLNFRIGKIGILIILVTFVNLMYVVNETLEPLIDELTIFFNEDYKFYQEKGEVSSGFGLIFYILIFTYILIVLNYSEGESRLIFNLSICSFLILPFTLQIDMIARMGFYFEVFHIALFPLVLKYGRNMLASYSFVFINCVFKLYLFFGFFESTVWKDYFGTYKTIFSDGI